MPVARYQSPCNGPIPFGETKSKFPMMMMGLWMDCVCWRILCNHRWSECRGEFINRSINTTIQNSTGKENAPVNRFCQSESLEKEFRKIIVTGEKRNRNLKYLFSKLC